MVATLHAVLDLDEPTDEELDLAAEAAFAEMQISDAVLGKDLSSPMPAWVKRENLTMVMVNSAYERTFRIEPGSYLDKTDYDVWPKKVANRFREHDREVLRKNRTLHFCEVVPDPESGEDLPLYVIKFPVETESFKGVGGVCVPMSWMLKAAEKTLGREKLCDLIG